MHDAPIDYVPYKEVLLCGNTLRNIRYPITVNDFPVFLIGRSLKARKLMIWLAAPLNKESSQWRYVIEGRRTNSPLIRLATTHGVLRVNIGATLVLEAVEISPDKAVVRAIDLRPLGLSIFGNQSELHVASSRLASNTFDSSNTAIAIA